MFSVLVVVVVTSLAALPLLAASVLAAVLLAAVAVPPPLFLLLLFCFGGSVGIHFGASGRKQEKYKYNQSKSKTYKTCHSLKTNQGMCEF